MSTLELRLFRYYVTLCEERHFGRAADRLGISPPSLTIQIQKLEKHLGVQLVRRRPKALIELTSTGTRFLESARTVIQQVDEAEAVALKSARGEVGKLEVAYMVIVNFSGLIEEFIGRFRQANPSIDITLHHMSTMAQIGAIASNKIDVGFARAPQKYPAGLSGFAVYRQPLVLAVPKDHPLASKRHAIDLRTLKDETFVGTSVEFELAFQRHVESIAGMAGFVPKISKRASDIITVLTYVAAGFGIAAVSRDLNRCHFPNVVYKELAWKPMAEGEIAFLYRTGETSPVTKAFIEFMRTYALDRKNAQLSRRA